MCSETFLRLPEEKKNRFLDAAWEEFTNVSYTDASINKIVSRARIPRGSFYQYFTDKQELFFYLLSGMLKHFYEEYNRTLDAHQGDIFRTQLHCFDRVVVKRQLTPLFAKGLEIMRLNPMFLMEVIVKKEMAYNVWESAREHIDHGMFRDTETEKQVFVMSLVTLVMTMTDAVISADRAERCRDVLALRLEVLKHGSPAGSGRNENNKEAAQ